MPGPRKDKLIAWERLEEVLKRYESISGLLARQEDKHLVEVEGKDMWQAFGLLKMSGRFDRVQILHIRKLLEQVWRMRNFASHEG